MSSKHDSKSDRVWRKIVSFMLFGMISLLCASVTLKVAVFDTSKLENVFTDYEYVSALRDDVVTYTSDIYAKNGLSSENVESIIAYSQLEEAVTAYIAYETNSRIGLYRGQLYYSDSDDLQ
ncbi:MAG: hypothetical protein LIO62_01405 [Clostridiales bacterium]|nr:hypothetical protein [Clostridiales bacterium]